MRRLTRKFFFLFTAVKIAARNFILDDCTTVSASISFAFLLSIIPFTALFLFILNSFQYLFLPELFPPGIVDILVEDINSLIPFVPKVWVRTHMIDSVGLGSFTVINLAMLPVISGLLFKSLEESFRRIFELKRRSLLFGQAFYAFLSIFGILLFFMVNFIWTIVSDATAPFEKILFETPYLNNIYAAAFDYFTIPHINIVSLFILVGFFLITVKVFLPVPIKLNHRLLAGSIFALLWLAARYGFGVYVNHVSRINLLFGSLSSVCMILLWIFYSSLALLFTVEYMYVIHSGRFKVWQKPEQVRARK
ncbi:MAG: YihY/virulence factor BrkB family protein [Desulfobacteraceae bacterium]|nr:YihY/virulence factor BrkB family protein [Desulfobacteraceae bacterium]